MVCQSYLKMLNFQSHRVLRSFKIDIKSFLYTKILDHCVPGTYRTEKQPWVCNVVYLFQRHNNVPTRHLAFIEGTVSIFYSTPLLVLSLHLSECSFFIISELLHYSLELLGEFTLKYLINILCVYLFSQNFPISKILPCALLLETVRLFVFL